MFKKLLNKIRNYRVDKLATPTETICYPSNYYTILVIRLADGSRFKLQNISSTNEMPETIADFLDWYTDKEIEDKDSYRFANLTNMPSNTFMKGSILSYEIIDGYSRYLVTPEGGKKLLDTDRGI